MVHPQLLCISVGTRLISSDFAEQAAPVDFLCICFVGVDHVRIVGSSKSLPHVAYFVPHQALFFLSSLSDITSPTDFRTSLSILRRHFGAFAKDLGRQISRLRNFRSFVNGTGLPETRFFRRYSSGQ